MIGCSCVHLALCGTPNLADERIVNGVQATPNEFPWVVGLVSHLLMLLCNLFFYLK